MSWSSLILLVELLPVTDQVVSSGLEIMGRWRGHTGVKKEDQAAVVHCLAHLDVHVLVERHLIWKFSHLPM